jgi:hypothetical protein
MSPQWRPVILLQTVPREYLTLSVYLTEKCHVVEPIRKVDNDYGDGKCEIWRHSTLVVHADTYANAMLSRCCILHQNTEENDGIPSSISHLRKTLM